ncbi:stimulated by retinoic acid gene 6 -like isoform X2 [Pelobates cultripes]|uniref:Stimulated by retinoic acid gene 6 -like isoform X2 n=1 Tax=Pelobates cultripes TaxID=61616 RepID=A0AAD1S8P0_PELCU|nr:stimulated by retinoic acid gene 6 -like isoform X2 [Pelobates cultripes]
MLGFRMIPFGTVYLLVAFQTLVATKFFLQNKISNDDKQKPLALNNRKAFQNFSYFFFFYHVIVGLGHCLSRVLKSLVLGSWLIARIDRTILPKGFEALDSGYRTWIGMLYMDHYHNNPVLVSFCHVLLQTRAEEEWTDPTEYAPIINTTEHQMPERAKTKWFLFYTLLRNPSIIKYRKKKNSEDCSL